MLSETLRRAVAMTLGDGNAAPRPAPVLLPGGEARVGAAWDFLRPKARRRADACRHTLRHTTRQRRLAAKGAPVVRRMTICPAKNHAESRAAASW